MMRISVGGAGGGLRVLRPEAERVDWFAGEVELVVEVRAGRAAGVAGAGDHLAAADAVAVGDEQVVVVAVDGDDAAAVVDDEDAAVDVVARGATDGAVGGDADRGPTGGPEIDAGVQPPAAEQRMLAHSERRGD